MPKTKQQVTLVTRLSEPDLIRFRELAAAQKIGYSELLRQAALFYMDNYDQAKKNELESVYAQQRKADTNRICAMLGKIGLEVHTQIEFLRRMEGGDAMVRDCMSVAAKRLDKSLDNEAEKIKEKMKKVIES